MNNAPYIASQTPDLIPDSILGQGLDPAQAQAARHSISLAAAQAISPVPFSSALVLGADASARGLDRSALRLAGVRHATGLASGAAALDILDSAADSQAPGNLAANNPAIPANYDLVVCDERLADMSALDFLRQMRERDLLGRVPVLILSPQATRRRVLAAIGAGCSGYLARPYTVTSLEAQLLRARTVFACGPARMLAHAYQALASGVVEDDLDPEPLEADYADKAANLAASAQAAFAEGTGHLLKRNWDAAIEAFSLCMRCERLEADACMGMAEAWRGKGNARKSGEYLQRAGSLYARARRWAEAREAFARLLAESPPEDMSGAPNPLLLEAVALLRKGDTDTAAHALIEACSLPRSENIDFRPLARASQFTDAPDRSIQDLCAAVARKGAPELGERLRQRLVGNFGEPATADTPEGLGGLRLADRAPAPKSNVFLRRFPLLHDVISVARFTAQRWSDVA